MFLLYFEMVELKKIVNLLKISKRYSFLINKKNLKCFTIL